MPPIPVYEPYKPVKEEIVEKKPEIEEKKSEESLDAETFFQEKIDYLLESARKVIIFYFYFIIFVSLLTGKNKIQMKI